MAIYLGNTLLTGPSGGGGDATLSADQTFTGVNTFNNAAGGIQVDRITGEGDTDTYIDLGTTDKVEIAAGGITMLELFGSIDTVLLNADTSVYRGNTVVLQHSSTQNILTSTLVTGPVFNPNAIDMDFTISKQTTGDALNYDASSDTLTVDAANIGGNLPPAVPTVDGDYKLVVSGGTVTWQTI